MERDKETASTLRGSPPKDGRIYFRQFARQRNSQSPQPSARMHSSRTNTDLLNTGRYDDILIDNYSRARLYEANSARKRYYATDNYEIAQSHYDYNYIIDDSGHKRRRYEFSNENTADDGVTAYTKNISTYSHNSSMLDRHERRPENTDYNKIHSYERSGPQRRNSCDDNHNAQVRPYNSSSLYPRAPVPKQVNTTSPILDIPKIPLRRKSTASDNNFRLPDSQSDHTRASQKLALSKHSQFDQNRQNLSQDRTISPVRNLNLENNLQPGQRLKFPRDPRPRLNYQLSQRRPLSQRPLSGQNPIPDTSAEQNLSNDHNPLNIIQNNEESSRHCTAPPSQNLKLGQNQSGQRANITGDPRSAHYLPPSQNLQLSKNPPSCQDSQINQNQPSQEQLSTQNGQTDQNPAPVHIPQPAQGSSSSQYEPAEQNPSSTEEFSSNEDSNLDEELPFQGVKRFEKWLYCSLCRCAFRSNSASTKHRNEHHARYYKQNIIHTCYAEVRSPAKKSSIVDLDFTKSFPFAHCYRCETCNNQVLLSSDEKILHISNIHPSCDNELLDICVPFTALQRKSSETDNINDNAERSNEDNNIEKGNNNTTGRSSKNNTNTSQSNKNNANVSQRNTSFNLNSARTSSQCEDGNGSANSAIDGRADQSASISDTALIRCNNCFSYFTCLDDHVNCGSKLTPRTVSDCELCGFIFSLTAHHARIDHKNDRACQFRQKRSPFLEKVLEGLKKLCDIYHVPLNNDNSCGTSHGSTTNSLGNNGEERESATNPHDRLNLNINSVATDQETRNRYIMNESVNIFDERPNIENEACVKEVSKERRNVDCLNRQITTESHSQQGKDDSGNARKRSNIRSDDERKLNGKSTRSNETQVSSVDGEKEKKSNQESGEISNPEPKHNQNKSSLSSGKRMKMKLFKCGKCKIYFMSHKLCSRHVRRHETLEPSNVTECEHCGLRFEIKGAEEHKICHHKGIFNLNNFIIEEYVVKEKPVIKDIIPLTSTTTTNNIINNVNKETDIINKKTGEVNSDKQSSIAITNNTEEQRIQQPRSEIQSRMNKGDENRVANKLIIEDNQCQTSGGISNPMTINTKDSTLNSKEVCNESIISKIQDEMAASMFTSGSNINDLRRNEHMTTNLHALRHEISVEKNSCTTDKVFAEKDVQIQNNNIRYNIENELRSLFKNGEPITKDRLAEILAPLRLQDREATQGRTERVIEKTNNVTVCDNMTPVLRKNTSNKEINTITEVSGCKIIQSEGNSSRNKRTVEENISSNGIQIYDKSTEIQNANSNSNI